MPRVALVIPTYALRYGGPIVSTHALAQALLRAGWGVQVITSDGDGPHRLAVPANAVVDGVDVRYLRRLAREAFVPQVSWALARLRPRPDVVHVAPPFAACTVCAHAAAFALRLPVVLSPRGSFEPWALEQKQAKKAAALAVLTPLLRTLAAVHATSESEREAAQRLLPHVPARVIPNGIDLPALRERRHGELPTVLFVGRLHPVKAIDRLLDACGILARKGLAFRLVVAGGGDDVYRDELARRQEAAGLGGKVDWLGMVDGEDKWRALADASVLALPSHMESFGNVVLEALASGTPVVASSGTPWAELPAERCGRWVPNDPAALAGALEPYLLDRALATEEGARGRRLVESKYTWDRVAQRMAQLYRDAMHRERPS
jgi:glycosyltransferase involved in cell wall biosynthesis